MPKTQGSKSGQPREQDASEATESLLNSDLQQPTSVQSDQIQSSLTHANQPQPQSGTSPQGPFVAGPGSGSGWFFPGQVPFSGQTPNSDQTGSSNTYPFFHPNYFPHLSGFLGRPEPGDPLYTASSDGPELRLISQQLTGQENYSTWAREFRRALVTKDKDGFIDGTIPYPTDERLARHWKKCNQLVRTWIGNCLSKDVAAGLSNTDDAKEIWANIKEMYGKLDLAKIFSLNQTLAEIKQGNLAVAVVFNRLSALWNELEMAEEKLDGPEQTLRQYRAIREREKVTRFLLVLNENFLPFRTQILAMDPIPPLRRIYQLAVQDESQRLTSSDHIRTGDSLLLAAQSMPG